MDMISVWGGDDGLQYHGSTDPLIILNTLEYYGIPQEVIYLILQLRMQ
jgi:hypothetical protein